MKRIFSILMLSALCLAFVACSDDDDTPNKLTEPIQDTKTYTFDIVVGENANFDTDKMIKLEDFVKLHTAKKDANFAEALSTSYIKITGITEGGHELKDLVLIVKGTDLKRQFGVVTKDETFNSVSTDLKFLDDLVKRLVNRKELTLNLQGHSTKEILKTVKFEIKLDVKFE